MKVKFSENSKNKGAISVYSKDFTKEEAKKVKRFHETMKTYAETELVKLSALAHEFGYGDIYVKDESTRAGLKAFKVLGGSYALGNLLAKKLGMDISEVSFEYLSGKEAREKLGDITFCTASDGNHGKGLAYAARELSQKAIIYLPKGTVESRVTAITDLGAEAIVTDMNYDDTVRYANDLSEKNGWYMVQDTAWEDYTEIPTWVMQGYMTMASEAVMQLGDVKPTHVFLQAGVGAMAGAVLGYLKDVYGDDLKAYVVEPDNAACIYESVKAEDGTPHNVTGDLATIMAGLSCGEPNMIGWDVINAHSDGAFSVPDSVAARGIRVLANPLDGDKRVVAGESGSVGLGLVTVMCDNLKEMCGLGKDSVVLLFNTEGDTDPVNYRQILWDGKYPL